MKFNVKFPDGHEELCAHSAGSPEQLASSGFGRKLDEMEAEGFEIKVAEELAAEASSDSSQS
jgi:hypothetical protein